jgi:hypothetical protein
MQSKGSSTHVDGFTANATAKVIWNSLHEWSKCNYIYHQT